MKLPRVLTVVVDSREQRPLLFPSTVALYSGRSRTPTVHEVRTEAAALREGDYILADFPDVGGVERKADLRELVGCLVAGNRLEQQLRRMHRTYASPCLMLELGVGAMLGAHKQPPKAAAGLTYDRLCRLLIEMPTPILWATSSTPSAKKRGGEAVVRFLAAAAVKELSS